MLFIIILYDEFSALVWAQANNDGFSLVDPIPVHLTLKVAIYAEGGTFKVDEVGECGQQFKQVWVLVIIDRGVESKLAILAMFKSVDHAQAHRVTSAIRSILSVVIFDPPHSVEDFEYIFEHRCDLLLLLFYELELFCRRQRRLRIHVLFFLTLEAW